VKRVLGILLACLWFVPIIGFSGTMWGIQVDRSGHILVASDTQVFIPGHLLLFANSFFTPYFYNVQAGATLKIPVNNGMMDLSLGAVAQNDLGVFVGIDVHTPLEISTSITMSTWGSWWNYSFSAVAESIPWTGRLTYKEYHIQQTYLAQYSLALNYTQFVFGGELFKFSYGRGGMTRTGMFTGICFSCSGWKLEPRVYSWIYSGKRIVPYRNPSFGVGLNISFEF